LAPRKRPSDNGITRREFAALARTVEDCSRDLRLQFTRIAQIQAELDQIRTAWSKRVPRARRR